MINRLRTDLPAVLHRLASSAWFAYGTLVLLQFKVISGMWLYRDLPSGDTSGYFVAALSWHDTFRASIGWSPLYTLFYGSLLNFSPDAYFVSILHRLIIIFVCSVLVLALMRRLLPHSMAWLIAAWWVVIPVTFDTLYEVHLFAVIPTLIAYLVALYKPTIWARGAALGVFLLSAFLSRNEIFIATGLWVLICFVWEIYRARKQGVLRLRVYITAYGVPVILALIVVAGFYWRSTEQFPELGTMLREYKHALNICQIYAYNYQQRFTDWTGSPWTDCHDLMQRDFGKPLPSLMEAIRLNPPAMLDYFLWNAGLIPEGVQVLLFNAASGSGQPDYIPRITGSPYSLVLTILAFVIVVVGAFLLRRYGWWEAWIKPRISGWLALLCTLVVMGVIALMQRPRPSYLYNLFLLLTAIIGLCGAVIVDRLIGLKRFSRALPLIALALIVFVPPFYSPTYRDPRGYRGRQVMGIYERLAPYSAAFAPPGVRVLGTGWLASVCNYLGNEECRVLDYPTFMAQKPADVSLVDWLVSENINLFYADEPILDDPAVQEFLQNSVADGWDTLVSVQTDTANWRLLQRR